jgi:hypothetical protein
MLVSLWGIYSIDENHCRADSSGFASIKYGRKIIDILEYMQWQGKRGHKWTMA